MWQGQRMSKKDLALAITGGLTEQTSQTHFMQAHVLWKASKSTFSAAKYAVLRSKAFFWCKPTWLKFMERSSWSSVPNAMKVWLTWKNSSTITRPVVWRPLVNCVGSPWAEVCWNSTSLWSMRTFSTGSVYSQGVTKSSRPKPRQQDIQFYIQMSIHTSALPVTNCSELNPQPASTWWRLTEKIINRTWTVRYRKSGMKPMKSLKVSMSSELSQRKMLSQGMKDLRRNTCDGHPHSKKFKARLFLNEKIPAILKSIIFVCTACYEVFNHIKARTCIYGYSNTRLKSAQRLSRNTKLSILSNPS